MSAMRPMGWPQNGPIEGSEKKKGSRHSDVNPYAAQCRRQDLNLHCLAATRPSTCLVIVVYSWAPCSDYVARVDVSTRCDEACVHMHCRRVEGELAIHVPFDSHGFGLHIHSRPTAAPSQTDSAPLFRHTFISLA